MKKMITRRNFLKAAGVSAAALGLAACGGSSSSTASSAASSTAASSTAAKADGKVYYLNFKPEQDQDWQDLAAEYTKETGVPVTVVTAASGQYETTLMSEMEKSEAPTLFQVNGPVGLANWKDYCYDLSGSQLYGALPPASSPVGVSAEQLQRKPGESPEEHIARITALLNAAAEAMAIAAMERRRRLEEQKRRAKMKL